MTNWEKMKDTIQMIFTIDSPEELADYIEHGGIDSCAYCAIHDRCDRLYYKHDENGNVLREACGMKVTNDDWPGCRELVLGYLLEEASDDKHG